MTSADGPPARDYYDRARHWREVAGPLADRALAADGVWTEIFDPATVRGGAEPAPVEAVLVALAVESLAGRHLVSVHRGP
jgi:hypothetical protein